MHDSNEQRRRWWQLPIGNLVLPVAAWAAIRAFSGAELNSSTAAEGLFLALPVGVMVAVLTAISPRPKLEAAGAALLAVFAVWGIYAVPTRGAAVGLILLVGLAVASWRRLDEEWPRPSWASLFQISLGLQVLFHSRTFLHVGWGGVLIDLLALPAAGALATWFVARRQPGAALVAGSLLVAQQGGWTVIGVAVLSAAAIAIYSEEFSIDRSSIRTLVMLTVAAAAALAVAGLHSLRWCIVLVMLMTLFVPRWRRLKPGIPVAALGVAALLFVGPMPAWHDALDAAWWLAILLPGGLFMAPLRRAEGIVALGFSLLALIYVPLEYALPTALGFMALALREDGDVAQIQGSWTAVLLALSALCASYPWLRPQPLPTAGALLGLAPAPLPAVSVLAVAMLLVWLWPRVRGPEHSRLWPATTGALACAVVALVVALPPAAAVQRQLRPEVLNTEHASWSLDVDAPRTIHRVVIDSYLSNSAALAEGTPVATIRLDTPGGARTFALRAGVDTGEWAAERPDVAAQSGFTAPAAWLSWVAPDQAFFARRYRARYVLEPSAKVNRLTVQLDPAVPKDVSVTLWHVELEP